MCLCTGLPHSNSVLVFIPTLYGDMELKLYLGPATEKANRVWTRWAPNPWSTHTIHTHLFVYTHVIYSHPLDCEAFAQSARISQLLSWFWPKGTICIPEKHTDDNGATFWSPNHINDNLSLDYDIVWVAQRLFHLCFYNIPCNVHTMAKWLNNAFLRICPCHEVIYDYI